MQKTDALLLIVASVLIASGVFVYSIPAGFITVGALLWALVMVDRTR